MNYRQKGCWYDNILVAWEGDNKDTNNSTEDSSSLNSKSKSDHSSYLVPAQLKMIFQIKDNNNYYCVIHSCYDHFDPMSVLSYIWMLEYEDVPVELFSTYKTYQKEDMNAGLKPIYRVVKHKSIHSHCLLIPFDETSTFVLQIKHPNEWANEFLNIN